MVDFSEVTKQFQAVEGSWLAGVSVETERSEVPGQAEAKTRLGGSLRPTAPIISGESIR